MIRTAAIVLAAAIASATSTSGAHADTDATTTPNGFGVGVLDEVADSERGGSQRPSSSDESSAPPDPSTLLRTETGEAGDGCADVGNIWYVYPSLWNPTDTDRVCGPRPDDPATVTLGMIRTAFTQLKLPRPNLTIQPPDHQTLVNFDTNFYSTTTQQLTHRVRLLGQPVAIRATPDTYTWHFGDDTSLATTDPGAPYPDLVVTHDYLRTGGYDVSLAITWTGDYRLGNGAWQQIPGTVTTTSPTQRLEAIEAEPKLVDPAG